MKCTEKFTEYFALIKDNSTHNTNFTSHREDALLEIPLQFAISKDLPFKLQPSTYQRMYLQIFGTETPIYMMCNMQVL